MADAIYTEEERRQWVERKMREEGIPTARERFTHCDCARCQTARHFALISLPVCHVCGDKRCPQAEDHRNPCPVSRGTLDNSGA